MSATPEFFYKNYAKLNPSNRTCYICREDYKEGEKVKILGCFHRFHPSCIDKWFTVKLKCPTC